LAAENVAPNMQTTRLQVSGVRFSFDPSQPKGKRVVAGSVSVGGDPLSPSATYRLATKEYLADGKDGYGCLEVGLDRTGLSGLML
jgi:5'-nucleotidase